jgi:hypothetical protein
MMFSTILSGNIVAWWLLAPDGRYLWGNSGIPISRSPGTVEETTSSSTCFLHRSFLWLQIYGKVAGRLKRKLEMYHTCPKCRVSWTFLTASCLFISDRSRSWHKTGAAKVPRLRLTLARSTHTQPQQPRPECQGLRASEHGRNIPWADGCSVFQQLVIGLNLRPRKRHICWRILVALVKCVHSSHSWIL